MEIVQNKPIATALKWQSVFTLAMTLTLAGIAGFHAALSAMLGGLIGVISGFAYGFMISGAGVGSADDALIRMMRAEAVKIIIIIALLWLVFATYKEVVGLSFIGVFIVTTLIFSMAIFIREN